jgi:hypothetical protein
VVVHDSGISQLHSPPPKSEPRDQTQQAHVQRLTSPALAGRVPTRTGHTLGDVNRRSAVGRGLIGVIIKQSRDQHGTWLLDPCMRLTEFGKAIGKGQGQEAGQTFQRA